MTTPTRVVSSCDDIPDPLQVNCREVPRILLHQGENGYHDVVDDRGLGAHPVEAGDDHCAV